MLHRTLVALVEEGGEQVDRGDALVQGSDERLDQRGDAVAGTAVAPALEGMAGGDLPAAAARGLVLAQGEVERVRDAGEERADVEAGGSGVDRVPRRDHQRVDLAALDLLGERREGSARRGGVTQHRARAVHGDPDVAEERVHGVRQRVDGGRLPLADQDDRLPPVGREVRCHRLGGARQLRREGRRGGDDPEVRGDGPGEPGHVGSPHAEPVVGVGAGEGQGGLGHVEAAHGRARLPVPGELAGEAKGLAVAREEIGVEGEDGPGGLERVAHVERASEGDPGSLRGVLLGDGRPGVEAGLREAGLDPPAQVGLGGRRVGGDQEREPGPAVRVVHAGELLDLGEEPAPGERLSLAPDAPGASRVVEVEQGSLLPRGGGAQAGRVGGVALHLDRPAVGGAHQEPGGVAVEGEGGGEVEALAGPVLRRLVDVGDDLLARRLAGGQAAQGRGGAQDLHERPAGQLRGSLGGAGRELPALGGGAALELPDALPQRTVPGRPGLAVVLDDRQRFHRWHVVQLTREWMS